MHSHPMTETGPAKVALSLFPSRSETRTVLAGCRASWQEALAREARDVLGASVCGFDGALSLVCCATEILSRGDAIDLVVLEGPQQAALAFVHEMAPWIPVIVVGRSDDVQSRIRAASGGAAAFLAEPVTMREVVRVASRLLHLERTLAKQGARRAADPFASGRT